MESKYKISQRNRSAVQLRAAGIRNTKDCITGSLTNLSCVRQAVSATDFLHDILRKEFYNQKSRSASNCNISQDNTQNEMIFEDDVAICFCPTCATSDKDISSNVVQVLQRTLQDLKMKLIKEKNTCQILRRDILVAKKVVEKEVAANTQDFESLLEIGNSKSWKGRQEIILALKRKLRRLSETVACKDGGIGNGWSRKISKAKAEDVIEISEDRQTYWYLELERREVWKNTERYRLNYTVSRDLMKRSLERLKYRNEKLQEEARTIQKKLSVTPKQIDEDLIQRLLEIKNRLKAKLEEKKNVSRKINILEDEISRNSIIKEELENALVTQKRVLTEKEEKVKSLKDENAKLQAMSESVRKERNKQTAITKKTCQNVEKNYEKIVKMSENLTEQLMDSKRRLETRKMLHLEKSPITFIRKPLSAYPEKIMKAQLDSQYGIGDSELAVKIPGSRTHMYKKKLLMYQSILRVLYKRNEDKMKNVVHIINETKELTSDMVEKHCLMQQLESDIKTLDCQKKKLKKSVLYSRKQKPVKKKNSSRKMMEILNEKNMCLAIKKKESERLKSLIMHVLASKDDDCDLFQSCLIKNNDVFLKELSEMKLLNAPRK